MSYQLDPTSEVLDSTSPANENSVLNRFAAGLRSVKDRVTGRVSKAGKQAILDPLTNLVEDRVERITHRLKVLTEQVLQVVFFFTSAVSCYFIGLFSNIGLEYFSVVDKQSMIGSIFLLTALFSSLRVVVSIIPVLWAEPRKRTMPADSDLRSGQPEKNLLGRFTWIVAGGGFAAILLGTFYAGVLAAIAFMLHLLFWGRGLRARLIAGLILGLSFGFLRAEHLREVLPTTALRFAATLTGLEQMEPVNVIMSAERGLLVVMDKDRGIRFVPWEQIAWIGLHGEAPNGWPDQVRTSLARQRQNVGDWLAARHIGR